MPGHAQVCDPSAQRNTGTGVSFIGELRRRNVIRVAGLYLVGAWLLVQVASTVLPAFDAPGWILRTLITVLAIGFLPALAFAWAFELTPDGLKRDADVPANNALAPATARRMDRLIIAVLALALGVFAYDRFVSRPASAVADTAQAVPAAAATPAAGPPPRRSIAVLPFEDLSGDAANAYFVTGMQSLILGNLAKIRDLKVISRTSTEKYASRPGNLKQVASELGVAHVLEGSVQRVGNQVLIELRLIDAATDAHVWAETYTRDVTDVFAVEQEVARTVAESLRATLSPEESRALATPPTRNAEAFDLFLRAEYLAQKGRGDQDRLLAEQAIGLYREAIAADPAFALAWANLALVFTEMYWRGGSAEFPVDVLARDAQDAVAQAMRLEPGLPEARLADAFVLYRIRLDFRGAVEAFDEVLAVRPGEARALYGKALQLRRLGRFDEAITAMERAVDLSPREMLVITDLATTYLMVRRAADAEATMRRALRVEPDNALAMGELSDIILYRTGDIAAARAVLKGEHPQVVLRRIALLRLERRYDDALRLLAALPESERMRVSSAPEGFGVGVYTWEMGRKGEARAPLRRARDALVRRLATLPVNSGTGQGQRMMLAELQAMLGDDAAALAEVRRALDALPVEVDAVNGAVAIARASRVYALLGRVDLVVAALARLRQLPGADQAISVHALRLDPSFDRIRNDPRFQAEVQAFAALGTH
jgi:TolB-like protein/Tfp pilus assembly protein PilF